MSYTRIDLESAVIRIGDLVFCLSSNPELGLPEHAIMMDDFDNDPSKIELFKQKLLENHQTALLRYIELREQTI